MSDPSSEQTERIRALVTRVILESTGQAVDPGPDDPLIQQGWLDSLSMVNLVLALQSEFACTLDVTDMSEENFGTVARITTLVETRTL